MKKSEFKKLVKETVRECLYEVLIETGAVSKIVTEVMKGVNGNNITPVIREMKEVSTIPVQDEVDFPENREEKGNQKLIEAKKMMLKAIGKTGYGGIDFFEGTEPAPNPDSISSMNPSDKGVDVSNLMEAVGKNWKYHLQSKNKERK